MMGNDWDLFEIVRSSAGNTAGAAKEDFLNDDDSFSFPNLVDTRNENHDPFGETFYRTAQSHPTTGSSGAAGSLGRNSHWFTRCSSHNCIYLRIIVRIIGSIFKLKKLGVEGALFLFFRKFVLENR